MPSPRPALAALGLVAACAACCSLPLLGGLLAIGSLAAWVELGALTAIALLGAGGWLLWRRRQQARACRIDPEQPGACATRCGPGCR